MPRKIFMSLGLNGGPSLHQIQAYTDSLAKSSNAPKPPSSLNASMIKRIHNVKPGCGSCGH